MKVVLNGLKVNEQQRFFHQNKFILKNNSKKMLDAEVGKYSLGAMSESILHTV